MAKLIDARLEEYDGKLTTLSEEIYKEKKDPKESVDEAFKKLMREEGPKAPTGDGKAAKPVEKKDGPQKLEAKVEAKAGDAKKAEPKKPEEKKK